MIVHRDAERFGSLDELAGHDPVASGGDKTTRWMIVRYDDGGRAELKASLEHFPGVNMNGRDRAGAGHLVAQKLIACVEIEHPKLLLRGERHHAPQIVKDSGFIGQHGSPRKAISQDEVNCGTNR